jgi:hypothetical protein
MTEIPTEQSSLAHASRDGHTCGREHAMRAFALALVEQFEGATDVFVTPEETFVQMEDGRIDRYRNAPEMVEALDSYLLTGEVPLGEFRLLAPDDEA